MKTKIIEHGFISVDGTLEVNMSSIFSKLIRVCGREVKAYNYDIYYDFQTINEFKKNFRKYIENPEKLNKCYCFTNEPDGKSFSYCIGFRKYGVDSPLFVSLSKDTREYSSRWQIKFIYDMKESLTGVDVVLTRI